MNPTRRIAHLDADSFFASVEIALKPELSGKPMAVTGGGRGIVLSATYPARTYGVKAGMPVLAARRACPGLACVPGRYGAYHRAGSVMLELVAQIGGTVERVSVDEAYWDLDGVKVSEEEAARLARAAIREVLGLPVSVGVASTRAAAKMASEQAKPDGFVIVSGEDELAWLAPRPVKEIPGVGPVTGALLNDAGITTIGDVADTAEATLARLIGPSHAKWLKQLSQGALEDQVTVGGPAKSVGAEKTFVTDFPWLEAHRQFEPVLAEAMWRLKQTGMAAKTVTVVIRYASWAAGTRSHSLSSPTRRPEALAETARRILTGMDPGRVRLLGVSFSGLTPAEQLHLNLDLAERGPQKHLLEKPTIAGWAFKGMPIAHSKYGQGVVEAMDAATVSVRFSNPEKVRVFDLETSALKFVPGY